VIGSADDDRDWRPPEARYRASIWEAERRLREREWAHALSACGWALEVADGDAREVALGLRHLAVAGLRQRDGDAERAVRQLARARRRLEPFPPEFEGVELAELLEAAATVSELVKGDGGYQDGERSA
jgi:hypothetical protein